jgi:hypothetical protein
MDMPRPEYEPLLILKFFRGPNDLLMRRLFSGSSGETLSEKLYFSENFSQLQ